MILELSSPCWHLIKPLFTLLFLYYLSDPMFNQMKSNSQALGADIQFGALNKVISYLFYVLPRINKSQHIMYSNISHSSLTCKMQSIATSDINLSAAIAASQALVFQKDSQPTLASTSAGRENWGETNMADASPRTDTSTDDTEDKNQRVIFYFHNTVYSASWI